MHSLDSPRLDPRVSEAVRLIMAGAHEPVSIARIAQHAGLSPSRLAHLFRAHVGLSPAAAIRSVRLDRAAELPSTTGVPLKEIAARAGMSASAFARSFRSRYGIAPSQFRARLCRVRVSTTGRTSGQPQQELQTIWYWRPRCQECRLRNNQRRRQVGPVSCLKSGARLAPPE